ncbi:MAG: hypothetical protein JRG67_13685 [Deltaproteobacteria bacterium]|nr:hypothetical protein [Deltaproteobacteria bacterium]
MQAEDRIEGDEEVVGWVAPAEDIIALRRPHTATDLKVSAQGEVPRYAPTGLRAHGEVGEAPEGGNVQADVQEFREASAHAERRQPRPAG